MCDFSVQIAPEKHTVCMLQRTTCVTRRNCQIYYLLKCTVNFSEGICRKLFWDCANTVYQQRYCSLLTYIKMDLQVSSSWNFYKLIITA